MKIIVTGGAGYIGSHTVVELYQAGFTPIIIDNLCNSSEKNIKGIEKIIGKKIEWHNIDCRDSNDIRKIFDKHQDIIGSIHFAAYKSIEESILKPKKYFDNNIGSLKVLLQCMEENNITNIIFSSSCVVYGNPNKLPVSENESFKKAESPYAETKQLCEKIISEIKCNSVSLRYFNPIGSHSSSLIGDYSTDEPSNLVPIITATAIGKKNILTIFGDDYNTQDGTCIRDYIHVVDLARSHVKSLVFLIKNKGKYIFNVGTGKGTSVKEIITSFEKSTNIKVNSEIGRRRNGDIAEIWSDNKLIKENLDWEATESLDNALRSAWKWEKNKKYHV